MMYARCRVVSLACALTLLASSAGALPEGGAPEGVAGPLVGAVTATEASIWMFVPVDVAVAVSYRAEGSEEPPREQALERLANPVVAGGHPARARLRGLRPATRYTYSVSVAGQVDPAWRGSFGTAPAIGAPTRFRVALTSCMKIGQPQQSWYLLLAQRPDLHLTVGDTHYADTTDPAVQWEHHLRYRRVPEFATVLREMPTLAVWDDHDYGPNDSDGSAEGKERSLAGWRQFWANPASGTSALPGAFFRYSWGDVDFFVVDGRYHRSPDKAPDDEKKTMLGKAQLAWLVEGLRNSRAKFKVIASGSTLDHSQGDGWKIYTHERHELFDAIRQHEISGVVYFSGDIHRSLVWEHRESDRVGYPLVEVISSGVANSRDLSFATIDFDTTAADPTMRVRIVFGDGTVRDDRTWKLSTLGERLRRF